MCPALVFRVARAAREVSLPASTSFSNSVSINEANECNMTYKSHGQARNLRLLCASVHESLPAVTTSIWFWIAFHIGVFIAIGIDLFTFHQRGRN